MVARVGDKICEHLLQLVAVGNHPNLVGDHSQYLTTGGYRSGVADDFGNDGGHIERLKSKGSALIEASQGEEVLDEFH